MKKSLRYVSLLVTAAITITLFANCGTSDQPRRAGEYLDDQSINARVKASMLQDDEVAGFDVSTTTYDGVVQLSGFVDSEEQKQRAEQVARDVDGVQQVVNNITLNPRATEYGAPQDHQDREAPEAQQTPESQPRSQY